MSGGVDSLLDALASGLSVDPSARDDQAADELVAPSRRHLYKNERRLEKSQDSRRRDLLQRQKQQRDASLDLLREVVADDAADDDVEEMDTSVAAFRYRHQQRASRYRNQLMFSEWLEEPPADLRTDWLLKVCPRGRRCLVVARRMSTRCYRANGSLLQSFPSLLPGGCRHSSRMRPTVLDCHWDRDAGTFHVLDVLCWNGQDITECDTDFRFSWLAWKMAEIPEVAKRSRVNPFVFVPIVERPATLEAMASAGELLTAADGVLFFHRAAHYRSGATPLVLWLKSFMLPEVVGLEMSPAQLGAPQDYTNRADYAAAYEQRRKQRTGHAGKVEKGASETPPAEMEEVSTEAPPKNMQSEARETSNENMEKRESEVPRQEMEEDSSETSYREIQ